MNCRFNYGMREAFLASFCNNGLHWPLEESAEVGNAARWATVAGVFALQRRASMPSCVFRLSPDAAARA